MHNDFWLSTFQKNSEKIAILWKEKNYAYQWLIERICYWQDEISSRNISSGTVVALQGDFSPESIALFFALMEKACIIVPVLGSISAIQRLKKFEIAQVQFVFRIDHNDSVQIDSLSTPAHHKYFQVLKEERCPGLILFTSGTSGEPKAAIHNLDKLLHKFKSPRSAFRILNFLLFDHWGGLNTMLHTLSNGGTIFTVFDRSPDSISQKIAAHRIEVLPTSPTFLNLLLLDEAHKRHDLSSLKIISYGTEPMQAITLQRLRKILPHVKLQQTYGLIELGVLRSKSKSSDSLWVKIGGEGYAYRVIDGMLQIKADAPMLGYLNAPSPFTQDGWFMTGDLVQVDGEYLRILGRQSEQINVGGEKVFPIEVESVIQELENVADVVVYPEKNTFIGHIVCAKVRLKQPEDTHIFKQRLKKHCQCQLEDFKIPVRIQVVDEITHSQRYKKNRRQFY